MSMLPFPSPGNVERDLDHPAGVVATTTSHSISIDGRASLSHLDLHVSPVWQVHLPHHTDCFVMCCHFSLSSIVCKLLMDLLVPSSSPIVLMENCSQPTTSAFPSICHHTQRTDPSARHLPDPFPPSSTCIGQPSSPPPSRPRRGPYSFLLRPLRALLHPPRNPPRVKRELSGSHRGAIFTSISIRIARASRACFAPVRTFCDVVEACGRHVGAPWTSTA